MKYKKGFTLIELVIVLAIMAILLAILIPSFTAVISKTQETKVKVEVENAITRYIIDCSIERLRSVDVCFLVVEYTDGDDKRFFIQNSDANIEELTTVPSALDYIEPEASSYSKKIRIYDFSLVHLFMRAFLIYELDKKEEADTLEYARFEYNEDTHDKYKFKDGAFIALEGKELQTVEDYRDTYGNDYICEELGVTIFFV